MFVFRLQRTCRRQPVWCVMFRTFLESNNAFNINKIQLKKTTPNRVVLSLYCGRNCADLFLNEYIFLCWSCRRCSRANFKIERLFTRRDDIFLLMEPTFGMWCEPLRSSPSADRAVYKPRFVRCGITCPIKRRIKKNMRKINLIVDFVYLLLWTANNVLLVYEAEKFKFISQQKKKNSVNKSPLHYFGRDQINMNFSLNANN